MKPGRHSQAGTSYAGTRSQLDLKRQARIGSLAKVAIAAFVVGMTAACGTVATASETAGNSAPQPIAIESIRVTAAGHFIDLRYRVTDPAKANELLGPGVKSTLIDERTGTVMEIPMTAKLGLLRQTQGEQRTDRSYFIFFANTAPVRSGSHVTAQIGPMRFEGLTVE